METKFLRVFELSPLKNYNESSNNNNEILHSFFSTTRSSGSSRVDLFLSNMNRYFQNVTNTRLLQGLQLWKVQDIKEFHKYGNCGFAGMTDYVRDAEFEWLTRNITMTGIVSLDMSSLLPMDVSCTALYRAIAFMVPNLQQLDLSRTIHSDVLLAYFVKRCPRLKIIRWIYNGECVSKAALTNANGHTLQSMNNLKELYFDNRCFGFGDDYKINKKGDIIDDEDDTDDEDYSVTAFEAMSDSDNHSNAFFFHKLRHNPLERISIRKARYMDPDDNKQIVPQSILMKFVRKAPATLVWFRSDLSPANIRLLQSERPGIQLLN